MLDAFRKIVQEVNSAASLTDALVSLVNMVSEFLSTDVCSVYLFDHQERCFVLRATKGLAPDSIGAVKLNMAEGLVGQVAAREEAINVADALIHPHFRLFPVADEQTYHAFLGVPIIHKRRVIGVLVVQNQAVREFTEFEESFLLTVSIQLAAVLVNVEASGVVADSFSAVRSVTFGGIAASTGTGLGAGFIIYPAARLDAVPDRACDDVTHEFEELDVAISAVKAEVAALAARTVDVLKPEDHALFDVYLRMLDEHALPQEVRQCIQDEQLWVQTALRRTVEAHVRAFEAMDDPYIRERAADVRDLGIRILAHLQQLEDGSCRIIEDVVLLGEDISTSWLMEMPLDRIKGIVTQEGASNSHMSIVARALNIPAVVGVSELPLKHLEDRPIIVDGHAGQVIANPNSAQLESCRATRDVEQQFSQALNEEQHHPSETPDGFAMRLWVNSGLMLDAAISKLHGVSGVGLYRTEIPFMDRECFPGESEQRAIYRSQLQAFAPLPVIMRTLDIGGDKSLPYFPIEEANPFLGWRGVRVTLDHPEIFLKQIKAMLWASEGLDNLRIMLPMISGASELDEAIHMIHRARMEVLESGGNVSMPLIGAMIEIPAAVYQVPELAEKVDFLSVGTNDLTQYLLAVDRNNRRVADLYQSFHPAVLRALRDIVSAADRSGKPVSVCGEMAGDPIGIVLLMGLGFRDFSMSPVKLLEMKWVIRRMPFAKARKVLEDVIAFESPQLVREYMEMVFNHSGMGEVLRPNQRIMSVV